MTKRILYALEDYPVISETYVETEIDYFLSQGIEIAAWCRRLDPTRPPWRIPVFEGPLKSIVRVWKPQAVHVHWFPIVPNVLVENVGVPITVRGHSFEFSPGVVRGYAFDQRISAVFLFPHLVDQVFHGTDSGCVLPLPCAFSEQLFYPDFKELKTVVRATAGLASKDVESFLDTAKLCPEAKFTLITSRPKEDGGYLANLLGRNDSMGSPVRILVDVPREEAARIVRGSEICLRSNNPTGHPFGMPISIAEAMGAAAIPVVRNHAAARSYVGDAGLYFDTVPEAVARIREILADAKFAGHLRALSIDRAKQYASGVVLPKIIEVWARVCGW